MTWHVLRSFLIFTMGGGFEGLLVRHCASFGGWKQESARQNASEKTL